ncbi:MAG: outer membrane lipoprotein chaperone LolA [Bacteroidetes bacterium]|nr:outer membrane lipoprotein chaperone LolA [Bacteroidota bacterium]
MRKLTIVFAILMLSALPSFAEPPSAMQIVKNVQDNYNRIEDATIEFTQTVVFPLSKVSRTTSGTLYIKKGNKYRIDTEDKIIVTDGKTSWVYLPQSQQVLIDNFRNDKNTITPEKFLLDVPEDYFAVLLSTNRTSTGNLYVLRLTPKSDNSFIRAITIEIQDSSWTIKSAVISDMNDTRYTYRVESLKTNTGLPNSEFEFVPPKGAQVVDLRQH